MKPIALALLALAALGAAPGVRITDARIPAVPPGMDMAAAYFTLQNNTRHTLALTGAQGPRFGEVSLHRSEIVQGMARMVRVPRLEIAPGAVVHFAPGGYHLMLMEAKSPPRADEEIRLTLRFANHAPISFNARVTTGE